MLQISENEYRDLVILKILSIFEGHVNINNNKKDNIVREHKSLFRSFKKLITPDPDYPDKIPINIIIGMKNILELDYNYDDYEKLDLGILLLENKLSDDININDKLELYILLGRFYGLLRMGDLFRFNKKVPSEEGCMDTKNSENLIKLEEKYYLKLIDNGGLFEYIIQMHEGIHYYMNTEKTFMNVIKYYTMDFNNHYPVYQNINKFFDFLSKNRKMWKFANNEINMLISKCVEYDIINHKRNVKKIERFDDLWDKYSAYGINIDRTFTEMMKHAVKNNFFEVFNFVKLASEKISWSITNSMTSLRQHNGNNFMFEKMFDSILNEDTIKTISSIKSEDIINYPNWIQIIYKLIHSKIDLIDLHYKYALDSDGYEKAKSDFLNHVANSS